MNIEKVSVDFPTRTFKQSKQYKIAISQKILKHVKPSIANLKSSHVRQKNHMQFKISLLCFKADKKNLAVCLCKRDNFFSCVMTCFSRHQKFFHSILYKKKKKKKLVYFQMGNRSEICHHHLATSIIPCKFKFINRNRRNFQLYKCSSFQQKWLQKYIK